MAQTNTNIAELKNKVDFGIITIREDEFEAVLQRLPLEELVTGRQRYAMSRLKTVSDDEYVIASVRCLEPGTGQAQEVARTMIDELNPQWILLVGIAGSMPDHEHTLGDVILSSRLHDFSVSAIIENSNQEVRQEFATGGGPMHQDVQTLLAALPALNLVLDKWFTPSSLTVSRPNVRLGPSNFYGDTDWKKKVKECLNRYFGNDSIRQYPKAFTGSIASSGVLLKDTQTASLWLKTSRDIKGMEMELAGVYQAAWGYQKPVLAIRGISDIVGFKRSTDWTSYACHTAAAFLLALLRSRPIIPLESRVPTKDELADSSAPLQNQQVGVFKQKPSTPAPVLKREQLFSNLLEVAYYPETLYSIGTNCKDAKAVWTILNNELEDPPSDWIYKGKTLYAFHDFSDRIWKNVCEENIVEPQPASHWSNSDDPNRTAEFIELLTNCLKEFGKGRDLRYVHKQKIKKETKKFRFLCYKPTSEYLHSPFFRNEDFKDTDRLVVRLKDKQTPLAEYLLANLPTETQDLIERYPASDDGSLRTALVSGFNEILKASLYNPRLFEGVHIRREVNRLMENEPLNEKARPTLNRMLLEDAYWDVIAKRVLVPRKIVIKSLVRSASTQVFKAFFNRAGKFSYYRHHAFRPHFMKIESKWHLEITPTYHYTWNGYRVSFFYEDLIKGIKRLERSGAVFRQVMFWARVLQDDKSDFLDQHPYQYLRFGKLLEFESDYGLRDELWLNRELSGGEVGNDTKEGRRRGRRSRRPNNSQPVHSLYES
jgi:nucleoside phosphorylase